MRGLAAAVVAAGVLLALPAGAAAQGAPCIEYAGATCQTVTVPLDRSGSRSGTVSLTAARVPARVGPARGTIFFLVGGPGQAALPVLPAVARLMAKYAPTYDLVTFDQRGTGRSSPLRCTALGGTGGQVSVFARCGAQLGTARGFYRTTDSVDDIEAVRAAFGSPVVDLYGVSYGGRVAAEYVRRYPGSVQRMVLDSPSTLEGTDPFSVQSLRSLPRVFSAICARSACRSFTRDSYGDVARLAAQLRRKPLRASVITASGSKLTGSLTQDDLFTLLLLSDLDPVARAELPSGARAARAGDGTPLARTLVRSIAASTGAVGTAQSDSGVSEEVFAATTCAEGPLPWKASSAANAGRDNALRGRLRQLGAGAFRPFTPSVVLAGNPILGECLRWPPVTPPVPAAAAGPNVPTLVVSGQEDLRTPLANARRLAAGYPGGRVLEIPGAGHSTLSTDRSLCSARATFGFLTGSAGVATCPFFRDVRVAPLPPLKLSGVGGANQRDRVVQSVRLAVRDVARGVIGSSASRFGGLRGGRVVISAGPTRVRLLGYQYIPGLKIDGTLRVLSGRLVGTLSVRGAGVPRMRVALDSKGRARAAASASALGGVALPARPQRGNEPTPPLDGVSRWLRDAAGR